MTKHTDRPTKPTRRRLLKQAAALGAGALIAPRFLGHARAQANLGPYQQAKINWRQAEGERLTRLRNP